LSDEVMLHQQPSHMMPSNVCRGGIGFLPPPVLPLYIFWGHTPALASKVKPFFKKSSDALQVGNMAQALKSPTPSFPESLHKNVQV
jgi:hypothetical protein